jgi:ATP citrate (pro-S)-lyase
MLPVTAVPEERRVVLASFIRSLLKVYVDLHFVYLEINPLVVVDNVVRCSVCVS